MAKHAILFVSLFVFGFLAGSFAQTRSPAQEPIKSTPVIDQAVVSQNAPAQMSPLVYPSTVDDIKRVLGKTYAPDAVRSIVRGMKDLGEVERLWRSMQKGENRALVEAEWMRELTRRDRTLALLQINKIDPADYNTALGAMVSELAILSPSEAFGVLDKLGNSTLKRSLLESTIRSVAQLHPDIAWARAENMTYGSQKFDLLRDVALAYQRSDPENAWNWAQNLPVGLEKNYAVASVFAGMANADPKKAASFFASATNLGESVRKSMAVSLAQAWVKQDPDQALAWASKNDNADHQVAVYAMMALASSSPEKAAAMIDNMDDIGVADSNKQSVEQTVAYFWSKSDSAAAIRWLQTQPPSPAQEMALMQSFQDYAAADLSTSEQAIDTITSSRLRDLARSGVATRLIRDNQDDAFDLISKISSPQAKKTAFNHSVEVLKTADPYAATIFLERGRAAGIVSRLE